MYQNKLGVLNEYSHQFRKGRGTQSIVLCDWLCSFKNENSTKALKEI